jgi:hypothetical protein
VVGTALLRPAWQLPARRWPLSTPLTQHEYIQFGLHFTIQWKAEAYGWTCPGMSWLRPGSRSDDPTGVSR